MKLQDFDYNLPERLIAHKPLEKRDTSSMLVVTNNDIQDRKFTDLTQFLKAGDVLVLNDSKVIPAKLEGICERAKVEINLIKKIDDNGAWQVLAKPGKKLKLGKTLYISTDFFAEVVSKQITGEIVLKFNLSGFSFFNALHKYGLMPIPPYITKNRVVDESDKEKYQTVYARDEKQGSVAAPTAGLHFTEEFLEKIKQSGVKIASVTLHVGAGTFFPVRVDDIREHKMHSEYYEVSEDAAETINSARDNGGRIICVGTTSLRVLESAADASGKVVAGSKETDIFIYPGYRFKLVDMLLTNFHLPQSTLFMLVSAFMGLERMKQAYQHAIDKNYRFFSYGDCSLLIRDKIVS